MKTLTFYRLVTQRYSDTTNRAEHRKVQATEVISMAEAHTKNLDWRLKIIAFNQIYPINISLKSYLLKIKQLEK